MEIPIGALGAAPASGLSGRHCRPKLQVRDLEVVVKARSNDIRCFLGVRGPRSAG